MASPPHPHRTSRRARKASQTAPSRGTRSDLRDTAWGLLTLVALLLVGGLITWLAVEGLRGLGQWWFVPLPEGQYIHLTNNRLNNHMALAGPVWLWFLGLYLVWDSWRDQVWHQLPRRWRKRLRRRSPLAPPPGTWMKLATPALGVTAACFLLTLPGMRAYEIMTPHELHRQALWSWAPQSWSLKDLTCLSRSEGSKGTVFWAFHFKGKHAFSTVGLTQAAMDRALTVSGVHLSVDSCP